MISNIEYLLMSLVAIYVFLGKMSADPLSIFFSSFLATPQHTSPRPGIRSELQLQPTSQLWQREILKTHCAGPGLEPVSVLRDDTNPVVL